MRILPPHWIEYCFTDSEMKLLDSIARFRCKKTAEKTTEQIQSKLDPFEITQWGVHSEYAVAKKLNLFFDWDCEYRVPFPMDLVLEDGTTIDVKCTRWNGRRISKKEDGYKQQPDFFIGTRFRESYNEKWGLKRCVEIIGWIRSDEFDLECQTGYNKDGNAYSHLGIEHFKDIHDFKTNFFAL